MSNARRIDDTERGRIIGLLDRMLVRHVIAFPCPLDTDAYGRFVEATMPDLPRRAWHAMRNWWRDTDKRPPYKDADEIGIPIRMTTGEILHFQITEDVLEEGFYPLFKHEHVLEPVSIRAALSGSEVDIFTDWVVNACRTLTRCRQTDNTYNAILSMASTVGQLHRMCPDLVRYTYPMTQEALARQERRSPLPDEWMTIDRRKIHDMLEHLALCHLLPSDFDRPNFAHYTCSMPWVFDWSTMGLAAWNAQPSQDRWELYSRFDLVLDGFHKAPQ